MAKMNEDIFKKTEEPKEGYDYDQKNTLDKKGEKNKVKALGVGLMSREWEYIDEIAQELGPGITGHAVAVKLLRDALKDYYAGEIEIKTETTKTTKLL